MRIVEFLNTYENHFTGLADKVFFVDGNFEQRKLACVLKYL